MYCTILCCYCRKVAQINIDKLLVQHTCSHNKVSYNTDMSTKNIPQRTPFQRDQDSINWMSRRILKLEAEVAALKFAAMTPQELDQLAANLAENDAFCETLRCNK